VRRRDGCILLALTVALGLGSRRVPVGLQVWDKSLGDVLYTVMVYLVLGLLRPTTKPAVLGALALAISFAIELFQLTGIPAKMPRILHVVFGTAFAWHDMACYVVGALLASGLHAFMQHRRVGWRLRK
jgi:hypothetical protein